MAASIRNHVRSAVNFRYFKGFRQISTSTTQNVMRIKNGNDGLLLTTTKRFHSSNSECQHSGTRARLWACLSPRRNLRSTNPAWGFGSGRPTESAFALATHVQSCRGMASESEGLTAGQIKSKVDDIAAKFTEARDLLEDARDVKGTVYFSEDMEEAVEAVDDTLKDYNNLLSLLNETQRQEVLRTIGLKMEELKAQKVMLEEEMTHDE